MEPIRLITPTQVTQVLNATEALKPTQAQPYTAPTAPTVSYAQLRKIYDTQKQNKQVQTFLANYNDPTELNSFIDALTNREAVSKKFGDAWGTVSTVSGTVSVLSAIGAAIAAIIPGGQPVAAALATAAKVAAIPAIPAAADVAIEKGIKPILAGKPKEALLNTMMNLGETMDYASNPIKGLIQEGPEGFFKGTGLASGGRVNYDFDTGFFLTDMLLEIISDPVNILEAGAKAGLKSATKEISQQATKEIVDNAVYTVNKQMLKGVGEITEEGAERISKAVTKATQQVSKEWAEAGFKELTNAQKALSITTGRQKIQQSLVNAIQKELPNATALDIRAILEGTARNVATGQFTQGALKQINNFTFDTLTTDVIKGLSGTIHYTDAVQKFMTKGALNTSGYGIGLDLAKRGWKGTQVWANNRILQALEKPQLFDRAKGLDFLRFEEAKNFWINSGKYTDAITGELAVRNIDTFYDFANQQLNRDKKLIYQILDEYKLEPIKQAAALDSQFQTLYGVNFAQYLETLKQINADNAGRFAGYVNTMDAVAKTLPTEGFAKTIGAKQKTGAQLFSARNPESLKKAQAKLVVDMQRIAEANKTLDFSTKLYGLKLNDEYVNALLVNTPELVKTFDKLTSTNSLGAVLENIIKDANSLNPTSSAHIIDSVTRIQQAARSFENIRHLYDNAGKLIFDVNNIPGLKEDDLRRYFIDVIFGLKDDTVTGLLANFDSTMNTVVDKLDEMYLKEFGVQIAEHPEWRIQMSQALRVYLEEQAAAGIDRIDAAIADNFTSAVKDLLYEDGLADYITDLSELSITNDIIEEMLASVRNKNIELFEQVFGDKNTIFNAFNMRTLADAGLAFRAVDLTEVHNMFNIPDDVLSSTYKEMEHTGKSIQRLVNSLKQYAVAFEDDRATAISVAYKRFYEQILKNPDLEISSAFKYLKETTDIYEQFAQLSTFYKTISQDKGTQLKRLFDGVFATHEDSGFDLLRLVKNPSALLTTDFAFDAMAQSAWIAEKQLNETIINGITAYDNLSIKSRKITRDFQEMRKLLTDNKIDRPKAIMLERYIKAASRVNDMLKFLENYYPTLFDHKLANAELDKLYNVLNKFPELNQKYQSLADQLKQYWEGTLKFEQAPKYLKGTTDYVDTFTPFWDDLKKMNADIEETIKKYNSDVYNNFKASLSFFDKAEWDKRKVKFDKELWNKIKAPFDKDSLKSKFKHFSIKDVPIEPDMSKRAYSEAVQKHIQSIKEYNSTLYDTYKTKLDAHNSELFKKYTQTLNEQNDELFELYTHELKQQNNLAYQTYRDTLIRYDAVTPWDPVREQQELNKLINQASTANAQKTLNNIFHTTPDEFVQELAFRKRLITFADSDIPNSAHFNKWRKAFEKDNRIISVYDENKHRWWFTLNKTNNTVTASGHTVYLNGNPLTRMLYNDTYDELSVIDQYIKDAKNPGLRNTFLHAQDDLEELTGARLGSSQGEALDKKDFEKLLNQKELVPEAVREQFYDGDTLLLGDDLFAGYSFNESVLGSAASKSSLGIYSGNMVVNLKNAMERAQSYLKPKHEYVSTVFDSALNISSPNSIWQSFSDQDLLEALQANSDYKLVALVDDKKYGVKVREILPTSIEAIKKGKELGAVIIPLQTFKDMYNVVNHRLGSTGFAKLWSRIMYTYKFGYLCRPGAWIRNAIDTNIKSALEMGGDFSTYKAQAHKILDDVNAMMDFVQARDPEGLIKSEAIKEWFAEGNAKYLSYEQFLELDRDFLSQGISGNIMGELYAGEGGDLWRTFTNTTGKIIDSANKTEDYNRLAVYLYELDRGADYTSALSTIAKTHFDYSFKTKAEQLADMIFPFTTFTLRNYSYWVETLTKHPWIMRNYVHIMKPHWDFKDYTPEELARDQRVQTQIIYGQLKLAEFNDKVLTFKANPSIQDAVQMFSDPINNVYEKLAAPIATPINAMRGEQIRPLNLLPMVGPAIQAAQMTVKTGAFPPSVIGVSKAPKRTGKAPNFKNNNLAQVNSYRDKQYKRPTYSKNMVYDAYHTKGITRYRVNMYPIIDVLHDVKMRYSINVYNKIKNRVQTDVYKGIRYRIKLDANKFRA